MLNQILYNLDRPGKSRFLLLLNLFIALLLVLFSACEDVIDIDLKDVEPQIVIEGMVTDQLGPYMVKISKTGDYFKPSTFPAVSGAIVKIMDDAGNSETLQETEAGIYMSDSLQGIPGRTYTLTVIAEGKDYTATSIMPHSLHLDSLSYEYQSGGGFGSDKKKGYKLHCYFTDPAGIDNYCRFKVYKNEEFVKGFFLYRDKYTDGNPIDYSNFKDNVFDLNDTINVELLTVNEATYDYFSTLTNVSGIGNQGPSATPANPNTNLSNDALGYFGAFTVRVDNIIIQ